MSPIQFQKQIRLQEARLLLATRPNDVTGVGHSVGHSVGYDSPSQFSREYRRQFGVPPSEDAARLRGSTPRLSPAPA
ncbi:helix-turn-helix domain-containing protein [Streptosporangium sp. NPDC006930]|uniref:helix-turn-helix domain-containing protein n=1 Tax=unclassified Streptosporangium TaxID=2632669 RepID=UPI003412FF6D